MNETAAIVAACGHLCHVPAALRSDLKERGMLARTVVVVTGELAARPTF